MVFDEQVDFSLVVYQFLSLRPLRSSSCAPGEPRSPNCLPDDPQFPPYAGGVADGLTKVRPAFAPLPFL